MVFLFTEKSPLSRVFSFIKGFTIPIVVLAVLLVFFLFSSNYHKTLSIDIVHTVNAFVILFILYVLLNSIDSFNTFLSKLGDYIIISGGFVALLGLVKLALFFKGINISFLDTSSYPIGSSLVLDRNFFSLYLLFSLVLLVEKLFGKLSLSLRVLYQCIAVLIVTCVLFTTSRRGILAGAVWLSFMLIFFVLSLFRKNIIWTNFRNNIKICLIGVLVIVLSFLYFLVGLSPKVRNELILNSSLNLSNYLVDFTFKTKSIYTDSLKSKDKFNDFFVGSFDSKYPNSGWAIGNYTLVKDIRGKNSEIVPKGSFGCKIDSSTLATSWKGSAYYSAVPFEGYAAKNTNYRASVYLYKSNDFNASQVSISARFKDVRNQYSFLKESERWEKKEVYFKGCDKAYTIWLQVCLQNDTSFDRLKGYVILAHPTLDSMVFTPENPFSWTQRSYKEMYPLVGKNVEIVPDGAIGLLIDSESNSSGTNKFHSEVLSYRTSIGKRYLYSIYCYVSPDFNGDNVGLSVKDRSYYDLRRKGEWQKLSLNVQGNGEEISSSIGFELPNYESLMNLKGRVVFAYPELDSMDFNPRIANSYAPNNSYRVVSPLSGENNEVLPQGVQGILFSSKAKGNIWNSMYYTSFAINSVNTIIGDSVKASIYCYQSSDFNGKARVEAQGKEGVLMHRCKYYDSSKMARWQKLEAKALSNGGKFSLVVLFSKSNASDYSTLTGHVIFAYPEISIKRNGKWLPYDDIIKIDRQELLDSQRELAEHKFRKSAEYSSQLENSTNDFYGYRVQRWNYAWYIFTEDYTWSQRLFGKGFGYTEKFANMFSVKTGFDYPHNPMLSVLLYSGIAGFLLYLYMLFWVFRYYLRYIKKYWQWALCFLVTFFFSFFSANGPFEPAVMGIFVLLPFLIHMLYRKPKIG